MLIRETHLFAVNVVISTLFPHAVRISSQLLPPVIRCTELNEMSSLEFFAVFAALPLDGAVRCFAACLCRLSAKNRAKTAFSFASRISTAVTCSNPWTFCACRKSKQHCTFSNCNKETLHFYSWKYFVNFFKGFIHWFNLGKCGQKIMQLDNYLNYHIFILKPSLLKKCSILSLHR